MIDRRAFSATALAATAAGISSAGGAKAPKLRKAVKFGMIGIKGSVEEKFKLAIACGFPGVELDSPSNIDRDEVVRARDKTGMVIHGVVDSIHWKDTLSSPDEATRADIAKGRAVLAALSPFDIGQGCVVIDGHVVAVEDTGGTDELLQRIVRSVGAVRHGRAGSGGRAPRRGSRSRS